MEAKKTILALNQLDPKGNYTYQDYLKWQFEERVELIRGKIFRMGPAPGTLHQWISSQLHFKIMDLLKGEPFLVFAAPFDVRLPIPEAGKDTTVVQPDLCIVCDRYKLRDKLGCDGAPDMVVEILSPGNGKHERQTKFTLYEESGVKEYWIVNPAKKTISIYALTNGRYEAGPTFSPGMTVWSPLFPELLIPVDEIFVDYKYPDSENMEVGEPIVAYSQLDLKGSYTYFDYLKWQFEERVELIRGKIFKMAPAPTNLHQQVSLQLTLSLGTFFKSRPCALFVAPFDVRLPIPKATKDSTVVQPDLCVICDGAKLDERGCNGAPDLAVEILSPGNLKHDLQTKFTLYEESGVKEYWIVQPAQKTITVYALHNGRYEAGLTFSPGMSVRSPLFPEMAISVDEIFGGYKYHDYGNMQVEEPIVAYEQLDPEGSYNYFDYLKWQFEERVELIRGKIFKMVPPAPGTLHQQTSSRLHSEIGYFLKNKTCVVFFAPFDVRLPIPKADKDTTVVQPDLCIICDQNKLDERGCDGAPDLVIEILSPVNAKHDLQTKFALYEESGVKEYWIVKPSKKTIVVYALRDGRYEAGITFSPGMTVRSPLFPDMAIPVDEIFGGYKNHGSGNMKVEEPIVAYSQLNPEGSYNYFDYLKWQFEERVELIRGKILKMSPAPGVNHQRISSQLHSEIGYFLKNKTCILFSAPFDVRLPIPKADKDTTVVQPDLCIICDKHKLRDKRSCDGAPDLVIEILSSGNSKHDLKTKFSLYEESGVKEYWIVKPSKKTVIVYALCNGRYEAGLTFSSGMSVRGVLFPDLAIPVDEIFLEI